MDLGGGQCDSGFFASVQEHRLRASTGPTLETGDDAAFRIIIGGGEAATR